MALSILGVVAAVVVPKFLNLQSQATTSVAQQMASELNNTYANWKASGGAILPATTSATTSELLTALTSVGSALNMPTAAGGTIKDSGSSQNVRIAPTADMSAALNSIAASGVPQTTVILPNSVMIAYDAGTDAFYVAFTGGNWVQSSPAIVSGPFNAGDTTGLILSGSVVVNPGVKGSVYGLQDGVFTRCDYYVDTSSSHYYLYQTLYTAAP